jgi:hypothetical protein
MTELRKAAEMALWALRYINQYSLAPHNISLPGEIDTAVDALRAAIAQPAVPEGYKLVPIEPTPEMVDAAVQAICYGPESGFTRIAGPYRAWRVMLAAAPSPQEQTP